MYRCATRVALLAIALLLWAASAQPARASNDPGFARQWGLTQVGAPTAWARSTGVGVKIGIVDSGIELTHEDLGGAVVASTSCIGSEGNPGRCAGSAQDDHGHGSHVAGIVGARKDNGRGVAGVAPDAQLLVARALERDGQQASGSVSDINAAIKWVVDRGARVVNLSLGGDVLITNLFGSGLTEGVEYAFSKGAVPVIASGNTNVFGVFGSSNYGSMNALVVAATRRDGNESSYSSPVGNAKWGLAAPGGDDDCGDDDTAAAPSCILSTYWDPALPGRAYRYAQGTSMAAPHVSAAVAAVFAANPGFTARQAIDRILGTLAPSNCGSGCKGRLDMANAVGVGATPPPPAGGGQGGGGQGGGSAAPSRRNPPRSPAATSRPATPRTGGATVSSSPDGSTTTTSQPEAYAAAELDADNLAPPRAPVRLGPDDGDDASIPAGVAALGGLGVLGAGGATAFVIRARGGAAAVLEALRPGAGP